jgi:IS5 family transposase
MYKKVIELTLNIVKLPVEKQYLLYYSSADRQKKNDIIDVLSCGKEKTSLKYLKKIIKSDSLAKAFIYDQIVWIGKDNPKKAAALARRVLNKSYMEILIDRSAETKLNYLERAALRKREKNFLTPQDMENSYTSLYSKY